jgi:autophagy-related protein 2
MFSATDWALRRLLKFVIKRSLGRYLAAEPDLEQLDVQLATGSFALRSVLLDTDAVSDALVRILLSALVPSACRYPLVLAGSSPGCC